MPAAIEHGGRLGALLLGLAFLVLLHAATLFSGDAPLAERPLGGADAYSRLTQVIELDRGGWYQDVLPRSNAPYGEPRVWSRAYDVVLWLGGRAMTPFLDFPAGLHVWGVLVAPALHVLALVALFWAATPLLKGEARLYLTLLFPFQVSITAQFLAGRADHHALQALLFVVVFGAGLRLIAGAGARVAILAGLALGAALWVSVEALVLAFVLFVALGLAWLGHRLDARAVAVLSLSLVVTLTLALMVERPPAAWLAVAFDRLSAAHLLPFSVLAFFWLASWAGERRGTLPTGRAPRLLWLMIGAMLILGLQLISFPKFFLGPMAEVAPQVRWLNVGRTSEYGAAIDTESLRNTLHMLLLYLGGPLIAAVVLPFLIAGAREGRREGWCLVAGAGAVYLALSLYQIRWGLYAGLLALPALAVLLQRLTALAAPWRLAAGVGVRASFKFAALLILGVAPITLGWWLRPLPEAGAATSGVKSCDVAKIAGYLMTAQPYASRPRRIVNFAYDGPELLYRSHHQVVATPNHRNGAGLLAAHEFFAAREPQTARRIAQERGLDLVLLCPRDREGSYYRAEGETVFWDRLRAGQTPPWLRPVSVPTELDAGFLLYRVVG